MDFRGIRGGLWGLLLGVVAPCLSAHADSVYFGPDMELSTGGGAALVTTNLTLTADPAWTSIRLQLGFGFATDEHPAPDVFFDSFSLTLQTLDEVATLLLLTADQAGVQWAPSSSGGLPLSPDLILREATAPGSGGAGYDTAMSFAISVALPSIFEGTSSRLYLDLFDNLDVFASHGWLTYARLVEGTTGNTPPVLFVADGAARPLVEFACTNVAIDADVPGNGLTFALVSGPAGATLDPASGVFRWMPALNDALNSHPVEIRVTDDGLPALSTNAVFRVTVEGAGEIRMQTSAGNPSAFSDDARVQIDRTNRLARVPISEAVRFHRLVADWPTRILRQRVDGSHVAIDYEYSEP